jgi:hypothetical protein
VPRIVAGGRPAHSVEHLFWWHPALKDQQWQRWRVKDGEKGPMVWEVKYVPFYAQGPDGLPGGRWHLAVARNVLDPAAMKFFVSNASPHTSVVAGPTSLGATARPHRRSDPKSATTQRLGFPLPHQANPAKTAETRH